MDLSLYKMTPLEEWITTTYLQHSITTPDDLSLEHVVASFGGEIALLKTRSHARWIEDGTGDFIIIIDSRLDEATQRSEFYHELCHPLRHVGNQQMLPKAFRDLQETQATMFQLYASIPFFMIKELDMPDLEHNVPYQWAQIFKTPLPLAVQRFRQIKSRINQEEYQKTINSYFQNQHSKSNPSNWSDETKQLFLTAIRRKLEKSKGVVIQ
ncbi:ImmA/IrrE family metallo-endopeptidase [Brevibacillus choshinensis]|uniref:ImmA/IrrE family metallo-endopeptidase n=1 Tax=Brevibacillus choshinensis TaxID=54911 RepID=A0ABX7FIY5_BRECH|nr:ImmA/IrrE family metallo-endopeptidase [Brevibacillus choshinensis]QRG65286.1 ImmA/IrrE family metallo-endopeptidase [Brevibacillus choshinensis]